MIFSEVEQHAVYRIANAPIRSYPYPHVYVENVFPSWFYEELLKHLPALQVYQPIDEAGPVTDTAGRYKDRYVITVCEESLDRFDAADREIWRDLMTWLHGENAIRFLLGKFEPLLKKRFKEALHDVNFHPYIQLLRDFTNYSLTPHTDAIPKVVVFIFYLPPNADHIHLGTSLYVPNDPTFRCEGGPHHPRERFTKVITMEYKPNTMLGFFKTSFSFHGVEPVTATNVQRDLIQYSIVCREDD
ncbi:MAG: hypothetical protein IH904_04715 [Proteobacteria bacterium]|nr:hypothetical protein [Pseudomonadota bacterium]